MAYYGGRVNGTIDHFIHSKFISDLLEEFEEHASV